MRLARQAQARRDGQRLERLRDRLQAGKPKPTALREHLARLQAALARGWANQPDRARLAGLAAHIGHLNPQAVLERGYSIARDAQGGVVRDSASLRGGETLALTFARGGANVRVESKA